MAQIHDSMVDPRIEVLLSKVDSRFTLVSLGAQRARQINAYFNQLGEGQGSNVPPQVTSLARKPLSIAFEEISADMIAWKTEGTALYQSLPALCHASLLPVTPLSEVEDNRPSHEMVYKTWKTRQ